MKSGKGITVNTSTSNILWDGNASKGMGVFNSLEQVHGNIDVIDDATLGQKAFRFRVFHIDDGLGSDRAKTNGL